MQDFLGKKSLTKGKEELDGMMSGCELDPKLILQLNGNEKNQAEDHPGFLI
jgi:hypothetical protein